jgi:hypothetical protein
VAVAIGFEEDTAVELVVSGLIVGRAVGVERYAEEVGNEGEEEAK